jgi:putative chitinase
MAKPTDNSEFFLDQLIGSIQSHLPTIKGIYITTSLYPGLIPGPGIVFWNGYSIPPAKAGAPKTEEPVQEVSEESFKESTTLTPEETAAADFATDAGYNGSEALAIGQTVGKQIKEGKVSISNLSSVIPKKNRNASEMAEPEPTSTEKITDCGSINLPTPNALLVEAMKKFGIDTPIRRAHFLAQCAHESGGFKWVREFASGTAYEGRSDLGNTQKGDGVKYKGRGYIQLTGRANYTKFRGSVKDDIVANPILVEQTYVAQSAAWFWKTRNFNEFANDDSVDTLKRVTKRVNGGYNGYEERKKYFCGYWKKLKENPNLYT